MRCEASKYKVGTTPSAWDGPRSHCTVHPWLGFVTSLTSWPVRVLQTRLKTWLQPSRSCTLYLSTNPRYMWLHVIAILADMEPWPKTRSPPGCLVYSYSASVVPIVTDLDAVAEQAKSDNRSPYS